MMDPRAIRELRRRIQAAADLAGALAKEHAHGCAYGKRARSVRDSLRRCLKKLPDEGGMALDRIGWETIFSVKTDIGKA